MSATGSDNDNVRKDEALRLADPLFVPVLTHYAPGAKGGVDAERMLAHLRHIRPHVRQVMLAGSTGDGWELEDDAFDALIDLAASDSVGDLDLSLLFGVLRGETEAVIARLQHLEARLAKDDRLAARVSAVAVCPPVEPEASQERIIEHFEAIMAASHLSIAVYQLPQVTGCHIAPETFVRLAVSPRVTLFKDSSGEDAVSKSGLDFGDVALVRGAEGGYLEALKPAGPYDGWLLSTGNALAAPLRRILEHKAAGEADAAATLSSQVSEAVAGVFDAAQKEGGANAFSNANRAMDHLAAHGRGWRDAPMPLKVDGNPLSREVIEAAERIAGSLLLGEDSGYLG